MARRKDYQRLPSPTLNAEQAPHHELNEEDELKRMAEQAYSCTPGKCLIILNQNFERHLPNLSAEGIETDAKNLEQVFRDTLKFDTSNSIFYDYTKKEILNEVKRASKQRHSGAFFFIILSHGKVINNKLVVLGTDGEPIEISQLQKDISGCHTLTGVPKIFLTHVLNVPLMEVASLDTQDVATICVSGSHDEKGSIFFNQLQEIVKTAPLDKHFRSFVEELKETSCERAWDLTYSMPKLQKRYFIFMADQQQRFTKIMIRYQRAVAEWVPLRQQSIENVQKIVEELPKHHKNVNISRITGSAASIGGSIVAIVGFALTPVTLGASLGLSIAGIGVAVAGGATAVGASIADTVIERHNIKGIQNKLDDDFKKLKELNDLAEELKRIVEETERQCPTLKSSEVFGLFTVSALNFGVRAGNIAFKAAELGVVGGLEIGVIALRSASIAARAISGVAIGASALLIPIDLAEIIRSIYSMAKHNNKTKSVRKLEEYVDELIEQKERIEQTRMQDPLPDV